MADNFLTQLFSRTSQKPAAPNDGNMGANGGANPNAKQGQNQNQQQQRQQNAGMQSDRNNPNPQNFNPNGNNDEGDPNKAQGQQSPLDEFSKLWEDNNANSDGEGGGDNPNALFKLDSKKLGEAVSKIDFTKNIDPQLTEAALKGDPKALSQVINSAAQSAFGQALISASQLIETGISKRMEKMTGEIDSRVKALGVQSQLRAKNAAFSHPSVKPLVDILQERFSAQFPNASAEDLHGHAIKYLSGLAEIVKPGKVMENGEGNGNGGEGNSDGEQDFSQYFKDTPSSLFPR